MEVSPYRIEPTVLCSVFDKENSIEFPLDSVYYLYMKSNPNPSFYPVLPYESLSSRTSINKKIKEKKKKNDNQKLKEKKRKEILNNDLAVLLSHDSGGLCTRTDHHMLLAIVLHMVVPLC